MNLYPSGDGPLAPSDWTMDARRLLALKARLWIDEYLARPRSGALESGSLQQ